MSDKTKNFLLSGLLIGAIVLITSVFFKVIAPSGQVMAKSKTFNLVLQNEQYIPNKIQVNLNDNVTLKIDNKDNILHGLHITQFNISEDIPPLSQKTVQFVATTNGPMTAGCANDQHKEKLDIEVI